MRVAFDDLPKYSPWPERLLGLKPWDIHYKNPDEIKREYDCDKWGTVNDRLLDKSLTLYELEREWAQIKVMGYTRDEGFLLEDLSWWQNRKLDLYENTIRRFLGAGRSLLELGCGYGSVIIPMAERLYNEFDVFGGGEYAESGLSALRLLVERQRADIIGGYCDFFTLSCDKSLAELPAPIIFTSFALMYIPELSSKFINWIADMKPEVVIHFEPMYFYHQETKTVWNYMCKRYIEVNDYNRNLQQLLHEAEREGKINILLEDKNVYGSNALLPISVVVWKPIA